MRAASVCLGAAIFAVALEAPASPPPGRNAGAPQAVREGGKPAPTPADRDAARTLSTRGYELFQQGNCDEAIAAFRQAEEHVHAPPHLVYIARCQAKLGKLLAAKQAYLQVIYEKLPDGAPAPFKDAQSLALDDLGELERRIPSLTIHVEAPTSPASVTVDELPLSQDEIGHAVPMDPGSYTLVASAPGCKIVERTVQLKEGQAPEVVSIKLEIRPKPQRQSVVPTVIAFSLGGLGLAAGGVTLGLALTETNPLETSKVDTLRVASIASFIAGGLGVGIGIALVVVRPKEAPPKALTAKPALRAVIGPASLGLEGFF